VNIPNSFAIVVSGAPNVGNALMKKIYYQQNMFLFDQILRFWKSIWKQRTKNWVRSVQGRISNVNAAPVLQEFRTGIQILQWQVNEIVEEASGLFQGLNVELAAMNKRITDNTVQILAITATNETNQQDMKNQAGKFDFINIILAWIMKSMKNIPLENELQENTKQMEEQVTRVQEVNAGLTTGLDSYKLSESSRLNFQQATIPGRSVHPQWQINFFDDDDDKMNLSDTERTSTWLGRIRGEAGSNDDNGQQDNDSQQGKNNQQGNDGQNQQGNNGQWGNNGEGGSSSPFPPLSYHGRRCSRPSRRQQWMCELELGKQKKFNNPNDSKENPERISTHGP